MPAEIPTLDVARARAAFPGLTDPTVFLDNAGGSQVLKTAADKVHHYLLHTNVQTGGTYPASIRSGSLIAAGAEAARLFINAKSTSEVVLGSSSTQVLANLALALSKGMKAGDEIIIDESSHEANIGPFVRMGEQRGATVKVWKVNRKTLELDLHELKALLTPKTRLVCVTHCSNVLGSINDIKSIAALVHSVPGAEICVDGVAYAPHRVIDVQNLGVDYYAFSFYKVYCPHIALLYTKSTSFPRLSSLNHHFINPDENRPYIYQPGGANYELTASLPALIDYLTTLPGLPTTSPLEPRARIEAAFSLIAAHEQTLTRLFVTHLAARPDVYTLIGRQSWAAADRVPTITFLVKGVKSADVVAALDRTPYGFKSGHFYAHRLVVGAMGLTDDGVVRVSAVHYNTEEEVRGFLAALDEGVARLSVKTKL
ncbi:pyridoxal phosphate-dependent transferase [Blyttiomyces helicus]|uniref:Pyridoxal phosphate-dependent transferase n=1 Tax=Blyttiomyces helicus TaxID=388810 RepID=A0A4P9W557_9FUNG|nr:pyridoxal phosphate-dependent transferase [Blyttiomyces helicus]|eukprot:RKO86443.1 pyridoxal phosphate-dependent transferase [Blyttiomyces helicus]